VNSCAPGKCSVRTNGCMKQTYGLSTVYSLDLNPVLDLSSILLKLQLHVHCVLTVRDQYEINTFEGVPSPHKITFKLKEALK